MAGIQVTDLVTEQQLAAHTDDLSLFGCFVETLALFPGWDKGQTAKFTLWRKSHRSGTVAYLRNKGGMGIAFTSIEPSCVSIQDAWLTGLRK